MTALNKLVSIFLLMLTVKTVSGQHELVGKYVNDDNPRWYLILNSDKSFKFSYRSHAYWDLACGQFEVKKDTLFFTYTSDMFDATCNSEGINMSDTTDYFLKTGVDKMYRPILAVIKKNKVRTIKTGHINNMETIALRNTFFRRVKKHVPK